VVWWIVLVDVRGTGPITTNLGNRRGIVFRAIECVRSAIVRVRCHVRFQVRAMLTLYMYALVVPDSAEWGLTNLGAWNIRFQYLIVV
jgi:hypothetical protein